MEIQGERERKKGGKGVKRKEEHRQWWSKEKKGLQLHLVDILKFIGVPPFDLKEVVEHHNTRNI